MALPTDLNIESLTYTLADRKEYFYLDRLLDRIAPVFSINDPTPQLRELGALTVLPVELLLDILENLSIIDLMRFRLCSRYSSCLVNTIPPLRTALCIAPNTVKGIMALQVSTPITAKQLCRKLYQRECDGCGSLAQCIYLPTCLRACYYCTIRFGPIIYFDTPDTEEALVWDYRLRPEQLAARPSFRPLLCTFTNGMNKFKMEERHILYDCPSDLLMEKLGWSPWYDSEAIVEIGPEVPPRTRERWDREDSLEKQDPDRAPVTVVRDPLPSWLRIQMAIVVAPCPDLTEQGVFCSACVGGPGEGQLYTKDAFLEHLIDCRVRPKYGRELREDPGLWLCEDDE